jgi:hypothetical protein
VESALRRAFDRVTVLRRTVAGASIDGAHGHHPSLPGAVCEANGDGSRFVTYLLLTTWAQTGVPARDRFAPSLLPSSHGSRARRAKHGRREEHCALEARPRPARTDGGG